PAIGGLLWHERPFQPGRETRPAAAAQARGLHLIDDPVAALVDECSGAVPGAAAARALEAPVVEAVEVFDDAILVVEHDQNFLGSAIGLRVSETGGAAAKRQLP